MADSYNINRHLISLTYIVESSNFVAVPFIPAGNGPGGCLQTFGDCREGQIPRCSAALQV